MDRHKIESIRLLELLLGKHSIDEVLDVTEDIFKTPVIFIDINFKVWASRSAASITIPEWRKAVEKGFCDYEFIFAILNMEDTANNPQSTEPYMVIDESNDTKISMVTPLIIDRKYTGSLITFLDDKEAFAEREACLLLANRVVTELILKNPEYRYMRGFVNESILWDLLRGNNKDSRELHRWIIDSDLGQNHDFKVFVIEKLDAERQKHSDASLRSDVYHLFPKSYSLFYEQYLVVLSVDMARETEPTRSALFDQFAENHRIKIGISRHFFNLEDFRYHYLQGVHTLDIGKRLHPERHYYIFDRYRYHYLFESAGQAENVKLKDFVNEGVYRLLDYDQRKGTELCQTLKTLILNNVDIKKTIAALKIHRNTLNYRIERIEDIGKINLGDDGIFFEIGFSLLLLEYLESTVL